MRNKIRNERYYSYCNDFVKATFKLLKKSFESGKEIPKNLIEDITLTRYEKGSAGWRKSYRYQPEFFVFIYRHERDISNLVEYKSWVKYMEEDPIINKHLDVLIGTVDGARRMDIQNYSHVLLLDPLDEEHPFEFNIERFNESYKKLEDFFYTDKLKFVASSPIENFECNSADGIDKIELDGGLKIVRISKEQMENMLSRTGIEAFRVTTLMWALEKPFEEEKVIGEGAMGARISERQKTMDTFLRVISALRILKEGILGINSQKVDSVSNLGFGSGTYRSLFKSSFVGPKYVLSADEIHNFEEFWHVFDNLDFSKHIFLDTAIRWFNYAYERNRPEDKIIDYMISFESIYLNDTGKTEYRGELSYRLSIRAAHFLGSSPNERERIFKEVRKAYDLRSKIVHGGKCGNSIKIDKDEIPIQEFITSIERYLRRTIKKLIEIAKNPHATKRLVQWDALIFPDPE